MAAHVLQLVLVLLLRRLLISAFSSLWTNFVSTRGQLFKGQREAGGCRVIRVGTGNLQHITGR